MKKYCILVFALILVFCNVLKANAAKYEEIMKQSKPCAILVYADWADDLKPVMDAMGNVERNFIKKYNFAGINICNKEAKNFNKTNYIYSDVPYLLLYKERGRISRLVTKDCIVNTSCIKDKLELFAN